MSGLGHPTGTVTFLFTDIEGSTRRWEGQRAFMQLAFPRQEAIMRRAIEANGGYAYKMVGDAFQAAFSKAQAALSAAVDAQLALHAERWPGEGAEGAEIRVRMALHTGVTEERGDDYVGPALNRVARLLSAGYGGQVLISLATQQLLRDNLPPNIILRDMGEHRLKDLTQPERIFQMVHPELRSEFPALKTLDSRPNNLPVQSTPIIGREREITAVCERLLSAETRLLTLTGSGGIGKTRLALQAAAELLDDFPHGAFFVNLVSLIDPNLVVPTIAYALGLRETGAQPIAEALRDYLKDKKLLLLLDNFEQVIEAAPQVADLIKSAPHLKVLVTSRESLRLSMEHEHAVLPLQTPDPRHLPALDVLSQYEAVRLFIQRARAVKPGFEVTNQSAPAVAEICYRLEGIPLAIELAAARIKALPPQALLAKLGSRLKLLTGGARDLHTRQQTLRNTIDWSYDLLTEGEKHLLQRLAVFRGGRTLEAMEMVCNEPTLEIEVLDGITSLVDKSLVYVIEGAVGAGGEPRYWMLETIQEYAWEKLEESGEAGALQREHALYFVKLAEEAERHLAGARQAEWLVRLEGEHDNLRAALRWVGAGDQEAAQVGVRLAGALWRFWYIRGHSSEGLKQLAAVLSAGPSFEQMKQTQGPELTGGDAAEGMALLAKALHGAGVLAYAQGNYSMALDFSKESLALRRELGDKGGVAASLNNLGLVAFEQGDYPAARTLYEESLALKRELGDKRAISASLTNIGNIAHAQGDYAAARAHYEESLAIEREMGDKWGVANSSNNLGNALYSQEDYPGAQVLYEEALDLQREIGDKRGIAGSLHNLGSVACKKGDYPEASQSYGEALDLQREIGDKRGVASSLSNLGNVAAIQGNYTAARAFYEESLSIRREAGDKKGIASCLAGLGAVIAGQATQAELTRAVRLFGAAAAILEAIGATLDTEQDSPYERNKETLRTALGLEAYERAWGEGRVMSMEQAMAYALETNR